MAHHPGLKFRSMEECEAGLDYIRRTPLDEGRLEMIVCRPARGERKVLEEAKLDLAEGLVGDNWKSRSSHVDMQLTVMNARAIALLAGEKAHWPLAGDQLFLDMDLSIDNLPAGTRLALGSAIIRISAPPHTGCRKFSARFGVEAMKFVNSTVGKRLRLRGVNASVVQPGVVRLGDVAKKIE